MLSFMLCKNNNFNLGWKVKHLDKCLCDCCVTDANRCTLS